MRIKEQFEKSLQKGRNLQTQPYRMRVDHLAKIEKMELAPRALGAVAGEDLVSAVESHVTGRRWYTKEEIPFGWTGVKDSSIQAMMVDWDTGLIVYIMGSS